MTTSQVRVSPMKGKHHSEETKRKISESQKGKIVPIESRKKMSESRMGKTPWNKGIPMIEETRQKLREIRKTQYISEETKEKISNALKGRKLTIEHCNKIANANRGQKRTQEYKQKMSDIFKGKFCGEKAGNWKGGLSFEPYCIKFNNEFKERVRSFFGYVCVECGTPQNGEKLHIHHVDFNKQTCCDNSIPLFVALCRPCHTATNGHREYWKQYFTEMITHYYMGKSYFTADEMKALTV